MFVWVTIWPNGEVARVFETEKQARSYARRYKQDVIQVDSNNLVRKAGKWIMKPKSNIFGLEPRTYSAKTGKWTKKGEGMTTKEAIALRVELAQLELVGRFLMAPTTVIKFIKRMVYGRQVLTRSQTLTRNEM